MRDPSIFLIVDDDPTGRILTEELLKQRFPNAAIWAFESAMDALREMELRAVDLVVSDNSMSDLAGLEFVRRLRKSYPTLLIIMHTASHEIRDAAMRAGVSAFVPSSETHRLGDVASRLLFGRGSAAEDRPAQRRLMD